MLPLLITIDQFLYINTRLKSDDDISHTGDKQHVTHVPQNLWQQFT